MPYILSFCSDCNSKHLDQNQNLRPGELQTTKIICGEMRDICIRGDLRMHTHKRVSHARRLQHRFKHLHVHLHEHERVIIIITRTASGHASDR